MPSSGGSNTHQQITLMQNKQKTNVQCGNSAEKPADSGVSSANLKTCSLAALLWFCCNFQKFLSPIVMLKEEFQKCKGQYLCHHKQRFLLHCCSTFLEKKNPLRRFKGFFFFLIFKAPLGYAINGLRVSSAVPPVLLPTNLLHCSYNH